MTVMVIGAHPDDEILGAGGTIAKYTQAGEKVVIVVFTKGEASHPWIKKHDIHKERVIECHNAAKTVGCDTVHFLFARDGHIDEDAKKPELKKALRALILKYKPDKIFTHGKDDIPFGHHAVYTCVLSVMRDLKATESFKMPELWGFNIWTMNIRARQTPRLMVDISDTFHKKTKALQMFTSQKVAIYQLTPFVVVQNFLDGIDTDAKYTEVFYKLL